MYFYNEKHPQEPKVIYRNFGIKVVETSKNNLTFSVYDVNGKYYVLTSGRKVELNKVQEIVEKTINSLYGNLNETQITEKFLNTTERTTFGIKLIQNIERSKETQKEFENGLDLSETDNGVKKSL